MSRCKYHGDLDYSVLGCAGCERAAVGDAARPPARRREIEVEWRSLMTGAVFTKRIPEHEPIPSMPGKVITGWRPL